MKTLLMAAIAILVWVSTGSIGTVDAQTIQSPRGRPTLNAARTTFVADNGQLLRGPYESTEWTTAAPLSEVAKMRDLGFNAVHLYAEVFNPNYPSSTNNTPGYAAAEVDKMVAMTRDLGLYLVMTIGNGANNGNHNFQWAVEFWNFYAPRYKDETHVVFEIHNEPVAWGPPYLTATTPPGAIDLQVATYNAIRSHAPDTPVLLMSYAVLGGNGGRNAAITDLREFNQRVFGNPDAVWTNEALGFHGYAGWEETTTAVAGLIAAGYPCFMTEFGGFVWGDSTGGLDIELTSELERLGVSWLGFQYIPPSGVSDDVTVPEVYRDRIENSGLSWTPDFGSWPAVRLPYNNGGQPRATTSTWVNNFLTGSLRIQAEDFDAGGEGVAYHDTDPGNTGGQYRAGEAVDIITATDANGGHAVAATNGEWLEYSISVREPGFYNLNLRYATPGGGGTVRAIFNARDKTGAWELSGSGGASSWVTAERQVFLEFGRQKLRLEFPAGDFNLNWIEISPSTSAPVANGTYKILNRHSGMAMLNDTENDHVVQSPYSGSQLQQWTLQHLGAGQYRIRSAEDGMNWNVWGGSGNPLGLVGWWGVGGRHQRYVVRPTDNGFFRIAPVELGFDFEMPSASTVIGEPVTQREYSDGGHQQWGILAPGAPQFPGALRTTAISATQVILTWDAVAGATSYTLKRSTASGGPYDTIAPGIAATEFTDIVAARTNYYYVVSAVIDGSESLNSGEAGLVLPYPWLSQDIGSVGISGSTSYQNGVFAQDGSGADIWGTADAFRYTYLPASGDCTIVARVIGLENTDPWAKAGVMIRETLDANARNVGMFVTPGNGVAWQYRQNTGGNTSNGATGGLTAPYWVRLERSGDTFTGFSSIDGATWTQRGTRTISMAADLWIGLALTSHNNSTSNTAIFDEVIAPNWVAGDPPPPPTGLAASGRNAAITLTWNPAPGADSYGIKRSATSGSGHSILASGLTATTFIDETVPAGQTFHYVVFGTGYGVAGIDSEEASATTLPSEARLRFDEGSGTVTADTTGNGWHGTFINGSEWAGGNDGLAVQLDGVDDHVTLPDGIVSGLGDFTIAAWVKLDSLGTWSRVFDFGTGTDNYMFLTPRVGNNGNVRFAIRTPSQPEQIINGTAPLPSGVWTHVAVTRSGTIGTIYVNGAAVGSGTIHLKPAELGRTTRNYLGRSQWSGDTYLDGQMDDFRIHASALGATDLAALVSGPPVVNSLTEAGGSVGVPFIYETTATNNPTGYAATGLPAGLILDESTGFITGTPAASGSTNVELSAFNFAGNGAATLALTITSPPITESETRGPMVEILDGNTNLTVGASVVGHLYQLQYRDDLAVGPWLDHGQALAGTGGALTFVMPVETAVPRRFYRVFVRQL